jgi:GNAT superfamily N-acetyltransferase
VGAEAVQIRRAGTGDLPSIMRLQQRSYVASLQEPASLFARILGAAPDTCLAAEEEGAMAGYLLVHPIPDGFEDFGKGPPSLSGLETTLYLHDMCVDPLHRNKGVGRLMFDVLSAGLRSRRFTKITAIAVQDSERFWKKRGFEIGEAYTYPGGAAGHVITRVVSREGPC